MCSYLKPRKFQVFPASVDFQRPSPPAVLPRMYVSPPPTHTMSGFDGSTPMAPMVPPKYLSEAAFQFIPPSLDLKTPPPVVPIQYSSGRFSEPAAATDRPPRGGPSSRQRSALKNVVS